MTAAGVLSKTFMEVVGNLRGAVDWDRRIENRSSASSINSSDGSFGDVVCITDGPIDSLGLTGMLWGYGVLLNDTKTSKAVVSRLLPPMTDVFVGMLRDTPIARQEMDDIINFMDSYNKARNSGRFDKDGVTEISRVIQQLADNFWKKCDEKRINEVVSQATQGVPKAVFIGPPLRLK